MKKEVIKLKTQLNKTALIIGRLETKIKGLQFGLKRNFDSKSDVSIPKELKGETC